MLNCFSFLNHWNKIGTSLPFSLFDAIAFTTITRTWIFPLFFDFDDFFIFHSHFSGSVTSPYHLEFGERRRMQSLMRDLVRSLQCLAPGGCWVNHSALQGGEGHVSDSMCFMCYNIYLINCVKKIRSIHLLLFSILHITHTFFCQFGNIYKSDMSK